MTDHVTGGKVGLRYRKKPAVVEAWQWNFEREGELRGVCNCHQGNWGSHLHTMHDGQIVMLEAGDWIIPEPDGEHYYPCKPDVFANAYELASAPAQQQPDPAVEKLILIARDVVWFDWSNNDTDACHAIDQLRLALSALLSTPQAAPAQRSSKFTPGDPVEVRKQNDAIDEIVIRQGDVHIEQMSGDGWFMGIDANDGSYWQFWFGAKNRKSHVEFRHTETVSASEQAESPALPSTEGHKIQMPFRFRPIFAWYDLWIGAYYDRKEKRFYIFPVPCLGLVIERKASTEDNSPEGKAS